MSASIEWKGLDEARDLLQGMLAKTDNLKPLLKDIGQYGKKSTKNRLKKGATAPDGSAWADYKDPEYADKKKSGIERIHQGEGLSKYILEPSAGGLLEHSGQLFKSISQRTYKDYTEWGSNKEYAATHQFGRGGIVARPYLGISNKGSQVIYDLIRQYYDDNHSTTTRGSHTRL